MPVTLTLSCKSQELQWRTADRRPKIVMVLLKSCFNEPFTACSQHDAVNLNLNLNWVASVLATILVVLIDVSQTPIGII